MVTAAYTLDAMAAMGKMLAIVEETARDEATNGLAVAIVGADGELVAFGAHQGCPPLPRRLAQRKAYTALTLRRSTAKVAEEVRGGSLDISLLNDPRLLPMAGGAPIVINGLLVGAIGISGLPAQRDAALADHWAGQFG